MGKTVGISNRLTALAQMVTVGNKVCDVGCDHGFLSIYLVQKGICPQALAMDVRRGPLSQAREHIAEYVLDQYIETRLSDGLSAYKAGEAQSLVCAGMGGRLMAGILERGRVQAQEFAELILQPQSELSFFRKFLRKEGYRTVNENMIEEEGKFYFLIKVVPTGGPVPCLDPLFDVFGEFLLKQKNPVLKRYLNCKLDGDRKILDALNGNENCRARERAAKVEEDIREICTALEWFQTADETEGI